MPTCEDPLHSGVGSYLLLLLSLARALSLDAFSCTRLRLLEVGRIQNLTKKTNEHPPHPNLAAVVFPRHRLLWAGRTKALGGGDLAWDYGSVICHLCDLGSVS